MQDPKYVDVNGTRTRYFDAGHGEPLVLVHGSDFGSHASADIWEPTFDELSKRFRVVAFDRIGTGFSDNPKSDEDYVLATNVRHAAEFIRALALGPVHLVGHSRGGYTATRVALEHPELVKTLVIVDSASLMASHNFLYDKWQKEALSIEDPRERIRFLMAANSFSGDHITERLVDVSLEIEALDKTRVAKTKLAGGLMDRLRINLVEVQIEAQKLIRDGGIKCPTLVIWAYNDPTATMERAGTPCMDLILSSVPRSQMVILNRAGHYVFREQPEAFNRAVIDFIATHHGQASVETAS